MANNKISKRKDGQRKTNPMRSVKPRIPRPTISFDGSTLNGKYFATRDLSALNVCSHTYRIDCSLNFGTVGAVAIKDGIGRGLVDITSKYQEYRYKSVAFHWLPHVAPGVADAGSSIFIAYLDNPEKITVCDGTSATQDIANAKQFRNTQTFNAWERFTYHVPLTRRLPWFGVNTNIAASGVEEANRTIQGLVIMGAETVGAAVDIGLFHITYEVELRGLNLTLFT